MLNIPDGILAAAHEAARVRDIRDERTMRERIIDALTAVMPAIMEEAAREAEGNSPLFDHQTALAECRDCESGFHNGRVAAAAAIRALSSPDHVADAGKLVESDAWLDIASAPMDKTPVIIAVPTKDKDGFIVGEAYFDPEHYDGGDWWWANTCHAEYGDGPISDINFHAPACWRPLPPPPAGKLADADRPSVKGTIPTFFGDSVCFSGIDHSALILVSVCGNSGLVPIKYLLPHQLYVHDVQKLSVQGEVLVCAVPLYSEQINVSSALGASQEESE